TTSPLSLHDALPIYGARRRRASRRPVTKTCARVGRRTEPRAFWPREPDVVRAAPRSALHVGVRRLDGRRTIECRSFALRGFQWPRWLPAIPPWAAQITRARLSGP